MIARPIYGSLRMFLIVLIGLLYTIPFKVLLILHPPSGYRFGRFFLRSWCRALDHKVRITGHVSTHKPTMFVGNHISYVDILVCGSLEGRFVAKEEVKAWPFFGFLTTWQKSIYISRNRTAIMEGLKKVEQAAQDGDNLIIFPEGTTTDGCRVLPFGSSFFNIAMKHNVYVQPFTICYERLDGVPTPRYLKKMIGWFSPDMDLLPHLWFLCQLGRVTVTIKMHEVLHPKDFSSRKDLADRAQSLVNEGRYHQLPTVEK